MTDFLYQLRHRSRALAHGLLLVLLATWLSTVCQHCLAQVQDEPVPTTHCQHSAPANDEPAPDGHACCPQAAAMLCDNGDCAQLSSVASSEVVPLPAAESEPPSVVPGTPFNQLYPAIPPPPAALAHVAVTDACPLYLRHCVFRL